MPIETVVLTTLRLLSIAFTALLGLAKVEIKFSDGHSTSLFSFYLTDTRESVTLIKKKLDGNKRKLY